MSRILKRPMFRIGGSTNQGIVSMVVPKRAGYAEPTNAATTVDNYLNDKEYTDLLRSAQINTALMSQFAGSGRSQSDRVSDLLIRGGLKTMSQRPVGGIFSTIAKSFEEPVEQYLKSGETEDSFQRQLRLAGLTQAMQSRENKAKYEKELAIAERQLKQKDKELFIASSSDKNRAYQLWDTLTALENKGNRVIKSEVPVLGDKKKTPDPKIVLGIPKDTYFPGADGSLFKKTDNAKGYVIVNQTGAEPDKPQQTTQKPTTAFERLKSLSDTGANVAKYGPYLFSQGGTTNKENGITSIDPRPWTKNSFYQKLLERNKNDTGMG